MNMLPHFSIYLAFIIFFSSFFHNIPFANGSLNLHSAIPDVTIKMVDQIFVVGASQLESLQDAIPACNSNFGPICHHFHFSVAYQNLSKLSINTLDYHNDWNPNELKFSHSDNFASAIHRYPIKLEEHLYQKPNFKSEFIFENSIYKPFKNLKDDVNNISQFNTFITGTTKSIEGIPLQSQDHVYLPEGLSFEDGIGDVYSNEQLSQIILQSLEFFTNKQPNFPFDCYWNFHDNSATYTNPEAPVTLLSRKSTQLRDYIKNKSIFNPEENFELFFKSTGWRGISYFLEFSSTLESLMSNVLPTDYKGTLPESLHTKWTGEWNIEHLPNLGHFNFFRPYSSPILSTLKNFDFNELHLNRLYSYPNTKKHFLLPSNLSSFAKLSSLTGSIDFSSPIVISSIWASFVIPKKNFENGNKYNTKGIRVVGMRSGITRWIIDLIFDEIRELELSTPSLQFQISGQSTVFNIMHKAKFTPYHRIDSISFKYLNHVSEPNNSKVDQFISLGGIVLNSPTKTIAYETIYNGIYNSHNYNTLFIKPSSNSLLDVDNQDSGLLFPIFPHSQLLLNSNKESSLLNVPRSIRKKSVNKMLKDKFNLSSSNYTSYNMYMENHLYKMITAENSDEAPLIPLIHLRSYDFTNPFSAPNSSLFSTILEQRKLNTNAHIKPETRIRKFAFSSHLDTRSPLTEIGIIFHNMPVESPVASMNRIKNSNFIFHMKPTERTKSAFVDLEDENNLLFDRLRISEFIPDSLEDAVFSGQQLMKILFDTSSNFSLLIDNIESFHVVSNGKMFSAKKSDKKFEWKLFPDDHSHHHHDHSHHDHSHSHHDHSPSHHDHSHSHHDHSHSHHDPSYSHHDHNHNHNDHSHSHHDHSHNQNDHSYIHHDHNHAYTHNYNHDHKHSTSHYHDRELHHHHSHYHHNHHHTQSHHLNHHSKNNKTNQHNDHHHHNNTHSINISNHKHPNDSLHHDHGNTYHKYSYNQTPHQSHDDHHHHHHNHLNDNLNLQDSHGQGKDQLSHRYHDNSLYGQPNLDNHHSYDDLYNHHDHDNSATHLHQHGHDNLNSHHQYKSQENNKIIKHSLDLQHDTDQHKKNTPLSSHRYLHNYRHFFHNIPDKIPNLNHRNTYKNNSIDHNKSTKQRYFYEIPQYNHDNQNFKDGHQHRVLRDPGNPTYNKQSDKFKYQNQKRHLNDKNVAQNRKNSQYYKDSPDKDFKHESKYNHSESSYTNNTTFDILTHNHIYTDIDIEYRRTYNHKVKFQHELNQTYYGILPNPQNYTEILNNLHFQNHTAYHDNFHSNTPQQRDNVLTTQQLNISNRGPFQNSHHPNVQNTTKIINPIKSFYGNNYNQVDQNWTKDQNSDIPRMINKESHLHFQNIFVEQNVPTHDDKLKASKQYPENESNDQNLQRSFDIYEDIEGVKFLKLDFNENDVMFVDNYSEMDNLDITDIIEEVFTHFTQQIENLNDSPETDLSYQDYLLEIDSQDSYTFEKLILLLLNESSTNHSTSSEINSVKTHEKDDTSNN